MHLACSPRGRLDTSTCNIKSVSMVDVSAANAALLNGLDRIVRTGRSVAISICPAASSLRKSLLFVSTMVVSDEQDHELVCRHMAPSSTLYA